MASDLKDDETPVAPADRPPAAEYWDDFYSWLMEQAAHLRAGHWEALDRENLAEEIESLGREQFKKLESALRVVILHLLKWDHNEDRRSRSWALSVREHRRRVHRQLRRSPGLKPQLDEALEGAYEDARLEASSETGLPLKILPRKLPSTIPRSWSVSSSGPATKSKIDRAG